MKLIDHIRYDFNDREIVSLYPHENFNTESVLEVLDSQEALFIKNGKILDIFPPGRFTLKTENIPLLSKVANIGNQGKTTFTSRIYYINMKHNFDFYWGTKTPMNLLDPMYNVVLPVGSSGHSVIKIINSQKLFTKFAGTKSSLYVDEIISSFRGLIVLNVKDLLAETVSIQKISILLINTLLIELSEIVKENLNKKLEEYGISLTLFVIENIIVSENDPTFIKLKAMITKRTEMDILGFNYNTERKFDVLSDAAKNQGSGGQIIGAGLGLGMGAAVGNQFGGLFANQMNISSEGNIKCSDCNFELTKDSNFCKNCGVKIISTNCSGCGAINEKGTFCSKCGVKR